MTFLAVVAILGYCLMMGLIVYLIADLIFNGGFITLGLRIEAQSEL